VSVESFLRGFTQGLQKRAEVAAVPGMSNSMPAKPPMMNMGINPMMNKKPTTASPRPPMAPPAAGRM